MYLSAFPSASWIHHCFIWYEASIPECCVSATVSGFALKLGRLYAMLYVSFLQRQIFVL